jgi:hypothetical protein
VLPDVRVSRAARLPISATSISFIVIIASKARFASSPAAARAWGENAVRDLPGHTPLVLAPAALAFLPSLMSFQ